MMTSHEPPAIALCKPLRYKTATPTAACLVKRESPLGHLGGQEPAAGVDVFLSEIRGRDDDRKLSISRAARGGKCNCCDARRSARSDVERRRCGSPGAVGGDAREGQSGPN